MLTRVSLFIFTIAVLVLQGCVAIQSFPIAARSGDTITLAVGSPDGMTKANTSVQYVSNSDTSNPINLPIRAIVRIRPDNTSYTGAFNFSASIIESSQGHSPWMSIIILDLPQNMSTGEGIVNVTTAGEYGASPNVNNIPISLEIIPGVGTRNTFTYMASLIFGSAAGNLSRIEPMPQLVVKPSLIQSSGPNDPLVSNQYGERLKLS